MSEVGLLVKGLGRCECWFIFGNDVLVVLFLYEFSEVDSKHFLIFDNTIELFLLLGPFNFDLGLFHLGPHHHIPKLYQKGYGDLLA